MGSDTQGVQAKGVQDEGVQDEGVHMSGFWPSCAVVLSTVLRQCPDFSTQMMEYLCIMLTTPHKAGIFEQFAYNKPRSLHKSPSSPK